MKPKLRFKGFDEEWEKAPLSATLTLSRGLTYSPECIVNSKNGVLVIRSSNINIDMFVVDRDDNVYVTTEAVNIPYVNNGDIIFTAANGSTRLVGKHCIIKNLSGNAVAGGFMLLGKTDFPDYTQALLSAPWYSKFLPCFVTGGNGALGNLRYSELLSFEILQPRDKAENIKIGDFFANLDELITATEARIEELRKVKAASLQAMFPQEGETKPRLRFNGFDDDWEYRMVGDVFLESNERGCQGLPLSVSISKGVYPTVDFVKTHTVTDFSNYKLVNSADIVYNSMRMWQGASGVSLWKGYVSPAYTVLRPNQEIKICSAFFSILFKLPWIIQLFAKNSQGLTKDTWNLKYPAISIIDIPVPKFEEQKLIADYFANLDRQISLEEQRLEKLRRIKAACLDNMFV